MSRIVAALMALAVAELSATVPATAQDSIPVTDTALLAEVERAEARGRLLWLYDQAAWHATDALMADLDPSTIENPRGYVVVPGEREGILETVFIAERDGILHAVARYSVRGSEVAGGGPIEGTLPTLAPLAERLFRAREPALAAMSAQDYGLCSREPPNTLALPPDADGNVAFYLLTSDSRDGELSDRGALARRHQGGRYRGIDATLHEHLFRPADHSAERARR